MASELFRSRAMKGATLTNEEGDVLVGNPTFAQTAHGFSVGNVLYRSSATDHAKGKADALATMKPGLSICIHSASANAFSVLRGTNAHTLAITHGLGGSFGDDIWLSAATAGAMTLTEPTSGFSLRLGYIIDATHIGWEPGYVSTEV